MFSMIIMSTMLMMLSIIIMLLTSLMSKKTIKDREKNSPFECGYDPMSSSRLPFSMKFFLITILFLIFDVEIALILPMILIMNHSNIMYWLLTSMIFIMILLMGLYHEWNQGMLNWTN
nr:NADH dehydrogenase subunit 3 [Serichlamys sp. ECU1]